LKSIDKLTGSDFFPDVIGMEQHFAFGPLKVSAALKTNAKAGRLWVSKEALINAAM